MNLFSAHAALGVCWSQASAHQHMPHCASRTGDFSRAVIVPQHFVGSGAYCGCSIMCYTWQDCCLAPLVCRQDCCLAPGCAGACAQDSLLCEHHSPSHAHCDLCPGLKPTRCLQAQPSIGIVLHVLHVLLCVPGCAALCLVLATATCTLPLHYASAAGMLGSAPRSSWTAGLRFVDAAFYLHACGLGDPIRLLCVCCSCLGAMIGSCVAVCWRRTRRGLAGMNHPA